MTGLHPDMPAAIQEVLDRAPKPLTLAKLLRQLAGPYKVPPKRKDALVSLLDSQAHAWPPATVKGGPRYWNRDARTWAAATIIEAARTPLAPAKLIAAIGKQYGKGPSAALLAELIDQGQLIRMPLFGGARAKLCSQVQDAAALRAELDAARRVVEAGYRMLEMLVGRTPRSAADPLVSLPTDILNALATLEPRKGLLVTAPRLYHALPHIPKSKYDAALLTLQDDRRVILHKHSNPHSLTAAERESLIADGAGNYYVGACWRVQED